MRRIEQEANGSSDLLITLPNRGLLQSLIRRQDAVSIYRFVASPGREMLPVHTVEFTEIRIVLLVRSGRNHREGGRYVGLSARFVGIEQIQRGRFEQHSLKFFVGYSRALVDGAVFAQEVNVHVGGIMKNNVNIQWRGMIHQKIQKSSLAYRE